MRGVGGVAGNRVGRADPAPAKRRQSRVSDAADVVAPGGMDGEVARRDRHRLAQPVQRQPLRQRCRPRRGDIDKHRLVAAVEQDHVEQRLALRAEQPGIKRRFGSQAVEIIGQQPLQERARVGPAQVQDGAIGKADGRHGRQLGCAAVNGKDGRFPLNPLAAASDRPEAPEWRRGGSRRKRVRAA